MYSTDTLFHRVFSASSAVMLLVDAESGAVLDANPAACRFYGHGLEALSGLVVQDLAAVPSMDMLAGLRQAAARGGDCGCVAHLTASGAVREVVISVSPLERAGRALLHLIVHDVTKLRQAEAAVEMNERNYRGLFDHSPVPLSEENYTGAKRYIDDLKERGIGDIGRHFREHPEDMAECMRRIRVENINDAVLSLYGAKDREEFMARFSEIFSEQAIERAADMLECVAAGGTSITREVRMRTLAGRELWVQVSWRVAPGFEGTYGKVYVASSDITAQKLAERAMRESAQLTTEVISGVNAGIVVFDTSLRYVLWNSFMERLTGRREAEVLGKRPEDLVPGIGRFLDEPMRRALQGETVATGDMDYGELEDGASGWGEGTFSPHRDAQGRIVGIIGVIYDITGRKDAERRVALSESRYRTVLENVRLISVILDTGGTIVFCNSHCGEVTGYGPAASIGRNWFDLFAPGEEREERKASLASLLRGEHPLHFERTIVTATGERRTINMNCTILRDQEGAPSGITIIAEDITARKRAEEALRESHRLNEEIISGASVGIIVYDEQLRYVQWNRYMEEITGLPSSAIVGKKPGEVFPHLRDQGAVENILRALKGETVTAYDRRYSVPETGKEGWCIATYSPHRDAGGRIVGVLGVVTDITRYREIERRMRQTQRQFRDTLENIPLIAIILNLRGELTFCNNFTLELSGFGREELAGKGWYDLLIPAELRESLTARFHRLIAEGCTPPPYESELQTAGGARRTILWHCTLVYDGEGAVAGMTALGEDITERKLAEQALHESEERLRLVVGSSPDYLFQQDRELRYVWFPVAISDPRVGDVIGKTDLDVFLPDEAALLTSIKRRVIETGEGIRKEVRGHLFGSEEHCFDAIYVPWRGKDGTVLGITGYVRDITSLKRAARIVEENEEKLRSLIEQMGDGLLLLDESEVIVEWNLAMTVISGIPREAMAGRSLKSALGEYGGRFEGANSIVGYLSTLLHDASGAHGSRIMEGTFLHMDGARRILQFNVFPIHRGGKVLAGVICRDVTAQRMTEEALHKTEEKYRTVINNINLGIALVTTDRQIIGTNRWLRDRFPALVADKPVPCHAACYHPQQEQYCAVCPVRLSIVDGQMHEHITGVRTVGGEKYFRLVASPVKDRGGRLTAVIKIFEDFTEKKKAEDELRVYQEKLRSLSAELSLVEEKERRRIATYLHDNIGQVLTLSKLKLSGLLGSAPDESTRAIIESVRAYIEESIQYTRSLTFELSLPILYELGFPSAVEWLADQVQERFGLACRVERQGECGPDSEVKIILFKVVRELLHNIVKHAGARQAVIRIQGGEGRLMIVVSDDGAGFDLSRVSAQLNRSRGYGLFNVREQIAWLGGAILINASPGKGTTVQIDVPLKFTKADKGGTVREDTDTDR